MGGVASNKTPTEEGFPKCVEQPEAVGTGAATLLELVVDRAPQPGKVQKFEQSIFADAGLTSVQVGLVHQPKGNADTRGAGHPPAREERELAGRARRDHSI